MFSVAGNTSLIKTTSHKVVVPFYVYAAISFLVATIMLLVAAPSFTQHYFHPRTLAITHIMALGWGTMIILGASHQLVPVLIEGKLHSNKLAGLCFILAATGIPLLSYGFYVFDMGWPAKWGGRLIILAIIVYLINLGMSMAKSKKENVHAVFLFTGGLWLLVTTIVGLVLVYNFTYPLMPKESLHYLALHAHTGVVGWFLLLVIGVGSRLIPMFLISKYSNPGLLWLIYGLINGGLASFVFIFLFADSKSAVLMPFIAVAVAIFLFAYYCYKSFSQRIRKKVDEQMRISLLSVLMMLLPVVVLVVIISIMLLAATPDIRVILIYGFVIFFGWITAIILGMTFKTLPFIVWNKVYHTLSATGKTPNPKDMFSRTVFISMGVIYLGGFALFPIGILLNNILILQSASVLLLLVAVLYNWNVIKILVHKPVIR
ncbi:MAG TPA: cytochrome C oxidase subunit I [Chitinophagaceae bacterium]